MIYLLSLLSSVAAVSTTSSAIPASSSSLLSSSNFLWGTATASYQVEGAYQEDGRGRTVWDDYSHTPGKVANGDTGDVATDHYHRFREDLDLISAMGINSYRLSLAWSRLIPDGEGAVNQAGIDHYNEVFDALEERNIIPFVTLFHWDTPSGLEEKYGGWLSDKMETCEPIPPSPSASSSSHSLSVMVSASLRELRRPLLQELRLAREALADHQRAHDCRPQRLLHGPSSPLFPSSSLDARDTSPTVGYQRSWPLQRSLSVRDWRQFHRTLPRGTQPPQRSCRCRRALSLSLPGGAGRGDRHHS
jgi:hypothetical protein